MVAVRSAGAVFGALLSLAAPSLALAEPYPGSASPPPRYPPAEIDAGGHVAFAMGGRCTRRASDVVGCSDEGGLAGFHVASRYRFIPSLALGLWGAVSSAGDDETWWQGTVTARIFPLPRRYAPLWFGVDGGLIAIAERLEEDELGPAKTLTHSAPLFAAGVGVNFPIAPFLTLGPELRTFVVPFGRPDPLPDRGTSHETQLAAAVGVTATLRLGTPD